MTWEERWHPLRLEWVVVAAHRQSRPWSGETVARPAVERPRYLNDCHLCPTNRRVSGAWNPDYADVFVFDNDHPCVAPHAPDVPDANRGLFRRRPARGVARVVCYSPRHDLAMAHLSHAQMLKLLTTWQCEYRELGARPEVSHVLLFENRGEVVGVSNPHPHCQIYATNFVFKTIEIELEAERQHWQTTGRGLLEQIVESELEDGRRVIAENEHGVAFLPFFARYSYETYLVPRQRRASIADLSGEELDGVALLLREVVTRFDNLWRMPFPYVMVLHQAPTDGADYGYHHFHIQFHPPLRAPHLLKYLAGPEVGGGCFIADAAPEEKARELREVPSVHYELGAAP